MAERSFKLFGFEIKKSETDDPKKKPSIVPARDDDGAGYVTAAGTHYGQYLNINGDDAKDNYNLIMKYRGVAMHPEVDAAIEDVVNESIAGSETKQSVDINLDGVEVSDQIKKTVKEEFDNILSMLNFGEYGHDIFRRWYVDGRLFYHKVIDPKNPQKGLQQVRYVDPRKIKKVREVQKGRKGNVEVVKEAKSYYLYNPLQSICVTIR